MFITLNAFAGFPVKVFFLEESMERPQASLAIQVLPMSAAKDELLGIVDKVIAYIKSTGLKTVVGPFETVIEGDFDRLMDIAKESQLLCIREGAADLLTYMKVAYNPGSGTLSIDEKIEKYRQ